MSAGSSIPLKVDASPSGDFTTGQAIALGHEILAHLEHLRATGQGAAVDLKSLPMSPGDYRQLKELLGEGEIDFMLDLDGPSRVRETAFAGVWWIRHNDRRGQVLAETIEINLVPQILATPADAIGQSADQLRSRLRGEIE